MRLMLMTVLVTAACTNGGKPTDETGVDSVDDVTDDTLETDDLEESGDTSVDSEDTDDTDIALDTDVANDTDTGDTWDSADTWDSGLDTWDSADSADTWWDTWDSGDSDTSNDTAWGAGDTATFGNFCGVAVDPYEPNSIPSEATPTGILVDGDSFHTVDATLNGFDADNFMATVPAGCRLNVDITYDPQAIEPLFEFAGQDYYLLAPFLDGELHAGYANTTGVDQTIRSVIFQFEEVCLDYTADFELICTAACTGSDSAIEPNEDEVDATPTGIAAGGGTFSQTGAALNAALFDLDAYVTELAPGCGLTATLNYDTADGELVLGVTTTAAFSESSDQTSGTDVVSSFNPGTTTEPIYVFLSTVDDTCALYDLDIEVVCGVGSAPGVDATTCANDPYEPNDDVGSATPTIMTGTGIWSDAEIGADARDGVPLDVFTAHVPVGCALYAELDYLAWGGDVELELDDGADVFGSYGETGLEGIRWFAPTSAPTVGSDYQVWLTVSTGASNTCNTYDLSVEVYCPDPVTLLTCGADADEPNDDVTTAGATAVAVGGDSYTALDVESDSYDDDFYAVTVPGGCTLVSELSFVDAISDLDLYLVDDNYDTVDGSVGTSDFESFSYQSTFRVSRDLYVVVQNYGSECNLYDLDIQLSCP